MKLIIILTAALVIAVSAQAERYKISELRIKSQTVRIVTAYNAGDETQTDSTPCIAANNEDICKALERDEKICAANFVPLGTHLWIETLGFFTVVDRMNKRYPNNVDIAMVKHEKKKALIFGRQKLNVMILY